MTVLGIDYGEVKVGLALARIRVAEPLGMVRLDGWSKFKERLIEIITEEEIEKIVVGISEGKTAAKTKTFAEKLKKEIKIPIEYWDETLSTQEAQTLSREGGMSRKKRNALEDAFAAAVMLQSYLDHV